MQILTGVGASASLHNERIVGWGGLKPSVVERPEIILEGRFSLSGTIRELNFRWKPGDVTRAPRQVAPYQPRLDWQMWFAALGGYQHNPWFVHLVSKLLHGCRPVVDLLNEPSLANETEALSTVRAVLYKYDFTTPSEARSGSDLNLDSNSENDKWWIRMASNEYLPTLSKDNPSLPSHLSSHGFISDMCLSDEEKCDLLSQDNSRFRLWCQVMTLF